MLSRQTLKNLDRWSRNSSRRKLFLILAAVLLVLVAFFGLRAREPEGMDASSKLKDIGRDEKDVFLQPKVDHDIAVVSQPKKADHEKADHDNHVVSQPKKADHEKADHDNPVVSQPKVDHEKAVVSQPKSVVAPEVKQKEWTSFRRPSENVLELLHEESLCSTPVHLGLSDSLGGWNLCGPLPKNCTVLSFGIGDHFSFDVDADKEWGFLLVLLF
jgi:hypothetical protein